MDFSETINRHQRQVHLDFHTSPFIDDVASEFDADAFAEQFVRAHVNSVTIFAKCHHGMCYYPTETGRSHPALKGRDLLGEQIQALHRRGIRCPIYTTVAWEEDVADRFPQWRQMDRNGKFVGLQSGADGKSTHPGQWRFNDFLHPEYQDYIEAHVREIVARYGRDVDGLFFDILFFHPDGGWGEQSVAFRTKHDLLGNDRATFDRFTTAAQKAFMERFTPLIRGLSDRATIFYNASNPLFVDADQGMVVRTAYQSHWELESLPSGFWGYHHFPRLARTAIRLNKPWIGQTGRFQKMWGDFGGIKPQAALEYECFRTQALGGANCVGDQLPPRGTLDLAAYDLIGSVYEQCAAVEPFYAGSMPIPQVGIVAPGYPGTDGAATDSSLEGAILMCDEAHYDSVILDDSSSFDALELVILPDSVVITDLLAESIERFVKRGGKLIASFRSGFDSSGRWRMKSIPLTFAGVVEKFPTYWRARKEFHPLLGRSDRVFYEAGMNVIPLPGMTTLVDRVLPYFKRTDLKFSSHFQTPPVKTADTHPAAIATESAVYFADPIFREYRKTGNLAARDAWKRAMEQLIGPSPFGSQLPGTILVVPRRRNADLLLTLLHYIPIRKSLDIDIIEERSSFAGELLTLPQGVRSVRVFETGEELEISRDEKGFVLPAKKGRLLVEAADYFV